MICWRCAVRWLGLRACRLALPLPLPLRLRARLWQLMIALLLSHGGPFVGQAPPCWSSRENRKAYLWPRRRFSQGLRGKGTYGLRQD